MRSVVSGVFWAVVLAVAFVPVEVRAVEPHEWDSYLYDFSDQDYFDDAVCNDDGLPVVAGYTQTDAGYDVLCAALDYSGDLVWEHTYGGDYNDKAHGIVRIPDGYIIVGETNSFGRGTPGYSNIFILKIDDEGNLVWQYPAADDDTAGGEYDDGLYAVVYDSVSGLCVAVGYWWVDYSTWMEEPCMIVFDPSGDEIDIRNFRVFNLGPQTDRAYDVTLLGTDFSAVGICGETKPAGSSTSDAFFMVVSESDPAAPVDLHTFGEPGTNDKFYAVTCDPFSGYIYACGETYSYGVSMSGMYVVALDLMDYSERWHAVVDGPNVESARDIITLSAGEEVYVLGRTNSFGAGYDDFYLVALDATDGGRIDDSPFPETFGGTGNDWASAICALPSADDLNLYLVGSTSSADLGVSGWDGIMVHLWEGAIKEVPRREALVRVSPNPFNSACRITADGVASGTALVTDLSGRVVARVPIENGAGVWEPAPGAPSGIYQVRIGNTVVPVSFVK